MTQSSRLVSFPFLDLTQQPRDRFLLLNTFRLQVLDLIHQINHLELNRHHCRVQ